MEIDSELPSEKEGRLNVALGVNSEGAVVGEEALECNTFNDSKSGSYLPHNGMEFETQEAAYSFYKAYARSVGFGVTIKASRRSKKSGKFIDVKLVCSKFGSKRPSCTTTSSRSCVKTNCKASMHVKIRPDGKWFVYSFVAGHNHEICPEDVDNGVRGKKSQDASAVCQNKGLWLVLDDGGAQLLLDKLTCMQAESPGFYYAIDFDKEIRMRNVFWVDHKGRHDYVSFCDVVFLDTHYIRSKYRIPFVPIVGVNHHFQFIMLGCALIGDETKSTFVWLLRTWLRAVGGFSPQVVITDNIKSLEESVNEVFPDVSHCFSPWHVLSEVGSNLGHKLKGVEVFLMKLKKCAYRSWTNEELEDQWQKMINKFGLVDDKWMQSLYGDRRKWIPTCMENVFLGGFCTVERSQSVASFFDKYLHKETTVTEFIGQYELFLRESSEEEAKAEIESHCSQPASHSSFEKQTSKLYTRKIYEKFQAEVSGIVDCTVGKDDENSSTATFRVDDLKSNLNFTVSWNKGEYDVRCLCRLFEYNGFLCRHALSVLQYLGITEIPSKCILKRWTQKAKIKDATQGASTNANFRHHCLNELCQIAVKLGRQASLSQEAYEVACHALEEALKQCISTNNSMRVGPELNRAVAQGILVTQQKGGGNTVKASKMKKVLKKQKVRDEAGTLPNGVQENCQDVEQMKQSFVNLPSSFFSHPCLQGMGNLYSLPSLHDCYYSDQTTAQNCLGNTGAVSTYASHPPSQHSLLGMGQFRTPLGGQFQLRNNLQNPGSSSNMTSKHNT